MRCTVIPDPSQDQDRREVNMLTLNEAFMAEKNVSKLSSYKVIADGIDLGKFKSSGIIVSTGTGSSGWLYGAKRTNPNNM